MDQSIKAGIFGVIVVIFIDSLSPINLDFILPFLAAILAIYIYRLVTLKDGLVAAFMTYIISYGILSTIALATFYLEKQPYTLSVDIWIVFDPIVTAITALIAGYIGVWLVQKRKRTREAPQPLPPQLPPV
jgi:hypothetical protein